LENWEWDLYDGTWLSGVARDFTRFFATFNFFLWVRYFESWLYIFFYCIRKIYLFCLFFRAKILRFLIFCVKILPFPDFFGYKISIFLNFFTYKTKPFFSLTKLNLSLFCSLTKLSLSRFFGYKIISFSQIFSFTKTSLFVAFLEMKNFCFCHISQHFQNNITSTSDSRFEMSKTDGVWRAFSVENVCKLFESFFFQGRTRRIY
jgi:hypothetical protein